MGRTDLEDLFATAPPGPFSLRPQISKTTGRKGRGPLALAEYEVGGAQVKLNWFRGLLSPLSTRAASALQFNSGIRKGANSSAKRPGLPLVLGL